MQFNSYDFQLYKFIINLKSLLLLLHTLIPHKQFKTPLCKSVHVKDLKEKLKMKTYY